MDEGADDWASWWKDTNLYAFVERRDEEQSSPNTRTTVLVLDLVKETDMDQVLDAGDAAPETLAGLATAQIVYVSSVRLPEELDDFVEDAWRRILIPSFGGDHQVSLFSDIGAIPTPAEMKVLTPPPDPKQLRLKMTLNVTNIPGAVHAQNSAIIARLGRVQANRVAAYDIGQGNCNAVCGGDGRPQVYYDFGGGCLGNLKTYPSGVRFCFCSPICDTIILSHWDFDHWFSALKHAIPRNVVWLAPRQSVGARTWKFASGLSKSGALWLWPQSTSSLVSGVLDLSLCVGTSRNDSGIALYASIPNGGGSEDIALCTGDAAFNNVPIPQRIRGKTLTGLVATHHGSSHIGNPVPKPTRSAVLGYSFGQGNTFGHPSASARFAYSKEGWNNSFDTPNGHIALVGPPCALPCARCTLSTVQP